MRLECGREKKHTRPHRLRRGSGTRIAGKNFKRHGRGRLDGNGGVDFKVGLRCRAALTKHRKMGGAAAPPHQKKLCAASSDTSGKKRPRPSSSKDCGGWDIAVTTVPGLS